MVLKGEEDDSRCRFPNAPTLATGLGGDRRVVALFPAVDAKTAPSLYRWERGYGETDGSFGTFRAYP
jgi:hypothetical protein